MIYLFSFKLAVAPQQRSFYGRLNILLIKKSILVLDRLFSPLFLIALLSFVGLRPNTTVAHVCK